MKSIFLGHYYLFLAGYFSVITALLLAAVYVFRRKWVERTRTRKIMINLSVSLFTTAYLLLALEGITAYSVVQSDGFGGATLASKRWFHQYWRPHNSYGYRDYEPEWKGKILFVVGDSFVAGHGVRNIDDRFSNQLSGRLGDGWTVTTLAKNGWNPENYIDALTSHDKTPDVIIVSYFVNDIQSAASEAGLKMPAIISYPKNKLIYALVRYSYLANWVYWRIHEKDLVSDKFWNYLQLSYSDPDVWKKHLQELDALIYHADTVDAEIAFIVWPFPLDAKGSKDITSRVSGYLRGKGVMTLDLSGYYEKAAPAELMVNSRDGHPNERVHAYVSELLYEALAEVWARARK